MPRKPARPPPKSARKPPPPPDDSRELMTQSEYARHREVTPERVRQWRMTGQLVTEGEGRRLKIDVAASDALLAVTRDPQQDNARGIDVDPEERADFRESQARKEAANAAIAELKLAQMRGSLVDRTAAVRAVHALASSFRSSLLNVPARAASRFAARFGGSEHEVREALDEMLREYLAEQKRTTLQLKSKASEDDAEDDADE